MSHVTVEKLVPGGEGFARLPDGRPVFVAGAFPGDVVAIERLTEKKAFARAEHWRLVEPSALRRAVPCPVFERCGGCDWMPLAEPAQREHKVALLTEALRRTGRFTDLPTIAVRGPLTDLAYRQRVRLHFDERGRVGYFARRSHEVVSAASCRIVVPELGAAIAELEEAVRAQPEAFRAFAEVEIRVLGAQRSLAFRLRRGWTASVEVPAALKERFGVRVLGVDDSSPALERWPAGERTYLLAAPGSFTQVNWAVNQAIVAELLEGATRRGLSTFLDLYCGVGNFSLPLLGAGLRGVGVDDDVSAIASARRAAAEQGYAESTFRARDVAAWLREASDRKYDLVVVDPPRAGIGADLDDVVRRCQRALFLCSCDPVTFARDLRGLVDRGCAIESVAVYDMFPQTHHFEVVCWLAAAQR